MTDEQLEILEEVHHYAYFNKKTEFSLNGEKFFSFTMYLTEKQLKKIEEWITQDVWRN